MFTRGYKRVSFRDREAVEERDAGVRGQEHSTWIDGAEWAVGHGENYSIRPGWLNQPSSGLLSFQTRDAGSRASPLW